MPLENASFGGTAQRSSDQRRDLLNTALQSIGDAVLATDTTGAVRFLNPVAEQLTGWKESDALGRSSTEVFRIINEDTRESVESPVKRVLKEGAIVGLANHTVLIARDGMERPIDDSGAPIRDSDGNVIGAIVVFRDITGRRRAEIETAQLAAIVQDSEDAIYTKTLDGVITTWNPGAERMYGYDSSEMIGRSVSVLVPPDRPNEVPAILSRLAAGERIRHYETERVTKDGRRLHVSKSMSPLRNRKGEIIGASTIARDMTDAISQRRETDLLNERLQRSVRETHHRIKNSLQIIAALISVQKQEGSDLVPASALDRVSQHVAGLAAIHDILTQTSKRSSAPEELSVATVLGKLAPMLQALSSGRSTTWEIQDASLPVRYISALTMLVNELVSNAHKHGKGDIHIHFEVVSDTARLEVCDEGPGFTAGTEIESNAGTGLELIRTIARWDLAGSAEFGNRAEGGARVVVEFPLPREREPS